LNHADLAQEGLDGFQSTHLFTSSMLTPKPWRIATFAVLLSVSSMALADDCPVGEALNARSPDLYFCLAEAKLASTRRAETPKCVKVFQRDGPVALEKTRACLKKQKNAEGMRALADYWAAWKELNIEMHSDGSPNSMEIKFNNVRKQFDALEVML
jgi:hypothetical protein